MQFSGTNLGFTSNQFTRLYKNTPYQNQGKISSDYALPKPDDLFGRQIGGKKRWLLDYPGGEKGIEGWLNRVDRNDAKQQLFEDNTLGLQKKQAEDEYKQAKRQALRAAQAGINNIVQEQRLGVPRENIVQDMFDLGELSTPRTYQSGSGQSWYSTIKEPQGSEYENIDDELNDIRNRPSLSSSAPSSPRSQRSGRSPFGSDAESFEPIRPNEPMIDISGASTSGTVSVPARELDQLEQQAYEEEQAVLDKAKDIEDDTEYALSQKYDNKEGREYLRKIGGAIAGYNTTNKISKTKDRIQQTNGNKLLIADYLDKHHEGIANATTIAAAINTEHPGSELTRGNDESQNISIAPKGRPPATASAPATKKNKKKGKK